MQKFGRLNVFNYEGVSKQMDKVKENIDRLLWGIWDIESEYIREEREKDLQEKLVIRNSKRDMNKVEAHERIQQICKNIKVKPTTVQ